MPSANFRSRPAPIQEYAAAVEKIKALQERETDTPGFNPDLKTIFKTHGNGEPRGQFAMNLTLRSPGANGAPGNQIDDELWCDGV